VTEAPIAYDVDRRALLAVAGLFAVNGALVGGVGATLPDMRVHLGPLVLSLILLALSRVLSRSGPWEDGGRPASLAIPESPRILR
jgi:hypothetical protein